MFGNGADKESSKKPSKVARRTSYKAKRGREVRRTRTRPRTGFYTAIFKVTTSEDDKDTDVGDGEDDEGDGDGDEEEPRRVQPRVSAVPPNVER